MEDTTTTSTSGNDRQDQRTLKRPSGRRYPVETATATTSSERNRARDVGSLSSSEKYKLGFICATSSDTSTDDDDDFPKKKRKVLFGQRKLNDYFLKNELMSEEQFYQLIRDDDPTAIRMYEQLMTRVHYNKMLTNATQYARIRRTRRSLQDRLEVRTDGDDLPTDEFNDMMAFLTAQGKVGRMKKTFDVLLGRCGKINCFYAYGEKNTGKTSFISYFSSLYEPWEIGVVNPCETHSQFWLMDLVDKEIYIGDEFSTDRSNLDTCKLLFEGSDNLTVDVKYENKKRLTRRPLLMASNERLEDKILRTRCMIWRFKPCKVNIHCDDRRKRQVVIRRLYRLFMLE